jgi:two-component system, chemotaxis family, protein-glutamate methylesterase/glutaminase
VRAHPVPPPLVVIGGSAGAIRPLREVLAGLPAGLPATVCVVIHMPDDSPSALARVLARAGAMDATFADDGLPLEAGRIAVAPPGNHLLVHDGSLVLSQGARENGTRPAIDPLFRSAARALGADVVSVLLSGTLDDGSAGTAAIRAAGGTTIVQDPAEADFPDMPRHAIETGSVVAALSVEAIPGAIVSAVEEIQDRRRGGDGADGSARPTLAVEPGDRPVGDPRGDPVDRGAHGPAPDLDLPASPYACPSCGGVLYERTPPDQFLCRVGHRFAPEALRAGQEAVIEEALWTALRTLEESASLAARLRDRAAARGQQTLEGRFEARHTQARARSDRIRALIEGRTDPAGRWGAGDESDESDDDARLDSVPQSA